MAEARALDNLRHEADVFSSDGEKVGKLHSVVVDSGDNEVTHLAVNAGPFFPAIGFGDPKIVSVDIEDMKDATEERVDLALSKAAFAALPPYSHQHFYAVPKQETHPGGGVSRMWDLGSALAASLATLGSGIGVPAEHVVKGTFERSILNDTPVWRVEPHMLIGEVERVIVDEESDEIQSLVIRRGAIFAEEVVLPMSYVTEVRDGVIRAQLSDAEIEALEAYHA
jgi:sporulation protein YlmC with PRC-barrel domain